MFERSHLQKLIKRVQEPRRFIQVIMGPRQVGKTTLVGQLAEKVKIQHLFISADSIEATNKTWLEQQWEAARLKMDQSAAGAVSYTHLDVYKRQVYSVIIARAKEKSVILIVNAQARRIVHLSLIHI